MEILNYFNISNMGSVNQRIYTKNIVEVLEAKGPDKRLLESSISALYLVGIISEDTNGIWKYIDDAYLYEEIEIFKVEVKKKETVKALNDLLQKVFPNPAIFVYYYRNQYLISTALKRRNKLDNKKSVVDSIQRTSWFFLDENHKKLLSKIHTNVDNLKEYYEQIDLILKAEVLLNVTGKIPAVIDSTIKKKVFDVEQILAQIKELEDKLKEETAMQAKMDCHMKITNLNKELEDLL